MPKISDAMRTHLLMLSEWWGYDAEDKLGARLMTHAPVTARQKIHVILEWQEKDPLPAVSLYPTAQAARAAWEEHYGDRPVHHPAR